MGKNLLQRRVYTLKKVVAAILTLISVCGFVGCTATGTETDYPAAMMVNGTIYVKTLGPMPGEVDKSAVIGYTSSYADTFPQQDGETNFNRELEMPYAEVEGGIAVLYDNEWYLYRRS